MDLKGTEMTWLGHATFSFRTEGGSVVIVDPWVMNNPACPDDCKEPDRIDAMFITHGHFDHIGDAVELAKKHQPRVFAIAETAGWLESKGVANVTGSNKGGRVTDEQSGVSAVMVDASHSCGIMDGDKLVYGGEAAGWVLEFPGGLRVYHAGDTAVFGDMKIIAELYEPDVCLLPIGDHFTMGAREAAYAVKLLGAKCVVPMHFGTFPVLSGTPEEFAKLCGTGVEVVDVKPGQAIR